MESTVQNKVELPHIDVTITYKGQQIAHHGAEFYEAIRFLIHVEESVRKDRDVDEPVDTMTNHIQHENMRKLLEDSPCV